MAKSKKYSGRISVYVQKSWVCPSCQEINRWADTVSYEDDNEDSDETILTCDECNEIFQVDNRDLDEEML
jgi:RNase P subunit RPR2